jgi:hypothetical protein
MAEFSSTSDEWIWGLMTRWCRTVDVYLAEGDVVGEKSIVVVDLLPSLIVQSSRFRLLPSDRS